MDEHSRKTAIVLSPNVTFFGQVVKSYPQ